MGNDVVLVCLNFLYSGANLGCVNYTLITLIPKVSNVVVLDF